MLPCFIHCKYKHSCNLLECCSFCFSLAWFLLFCLLAFMLSQFLPLPIFEYWLSCFLSCKDFCDLYDDNWLTLLHALLQYPCLLYCYLTCVHSLIASLIAWLLSPLLFVEFVSSFLCCIHSCNLLTCILAFLLQAFTWFTSARFLFVSAYICTNDLLHDLINDLLMICYKNLMNDFSMICYKNLLQELLL